MKFVYLAIFIIFTTIHLYGSYKNNKSLRNATKGIILLSILGFYLESVDTPSWFLIIALLTSWLGDMLLIPNGVKWFTAGGISFMISHGFFIASYSETFSFCNVPVWLIIVLALLFSAAVTFIFSKLKQYLPKALFYPMFLYLLINGGMNCFAIYRMIASFGINTLITAIGAILFFISDSSLFFVRFNKNSVMKTHFLVMITYSIGEFLIILGMVL